MDLFHGSIFHFLVELGVPADEFGTLVAMRKRFERFLGLADILHSKSLV